MKNSYIVPQVSFEEFSITQKIAGVCGTDWTEVVHKEFGYFNTKSGECNDQYQLNYNMITGESLGEGEYLTICYHSVGALHQS